MVKVAFGNDEDGDYDKKKQNKRYQGVEKKTIKAKKNEHRSEKREQKQENRTKKMTNAKLYIHIYYMYTCSFLKMLT